MTKWTRVLVPAVILASALTACGSEQGQNGDGNGSRGGGGRAVEVTAAEFAFDPTAVDAEPGEALEITLVNNDDVSHSITFDDPSFEIEASAGESATGTFTVPDSGGAAFHCKFHDNMKGTIGATSAGGDGSMTEDDTESKNESDAGYDY